MSAVDEEVSVSRLNDFDSPDTIGIVAVLRAVRTRVGDFEVTGMELRLNYNSD